MPDYSTWDGLKASACVTASFVQILELLIGLKMDFEFKVVVAPVEFHVEIGEHVVGADHNKVEVG